MLPGGSVVAFIHVSEMGMRGIVARGTMNRGEHVSSES